MYQTPLDGLQTPRSSGTSLNGSIVETNEPPAYTYSRAGPVAGRLGGDGIGRGLAAMPPGKLETLRRIETTPNAAITAISTKRIMRALPGLPGFLPFCPLAALSFLLDIVLTCGPILRFFVLVYFWKLRRPWEVEEFLSSADKLKQAEFCKEV